MDLKAGQGAARAQSQRNTRTSESLGTDLGVSENIRVPYFGVLTLRILITIQGTILGSPIFGNPHLGESVVFSDQSRRGPVPPLERTPFKRVPQPILVLFVRRKLSKKPWQLWATVLMGTFLSC